jgi:hypothetical protein
MEESEALAMKYKPSLHHCVARVIAILSQLWWALDSGLSLYLGDDQ